MVIFCSIFPRLPAIFCLARNDPNQDGGRGAARSVTRRIFQALTVDKQEQCNSSPDHARDLYNLQGTPTEVFLVFSLIEFLEMLSSFALPGSIIALVLAGTSAAQSLPVVDLGYAAHQATLNVGSKQLSYESIILTI